MVEPNQEGSGVAFGDAELVGMTELELDHQCEELFKDTPIEFIARKNVALD